MLRVRPAFPVTTLLAVGVALALELISFDTSAGHTRPHFEPTDLELEDPGVTELDVQVGPTRGNRDTGNRLLVPDFEFDLGLLSNVELDLDGAFSINRYDRPTRSVSGDPLWPAMKLGLYDSRDDSSPRAVAVGLQLGPRIATIGARGVGYEALGLAGFTDHGRQVVLNAGGIIDPGDQITRGQAKSVVGGVDISVDLDSASTWSLLGEIAGAHYVSSDPDEFSTTVGIQWSVTPSLDLSTVVLAGFLPGGDRAALFFGASPKIALW